MSSDTKEEQSSHQHHHVHEKDDSADERLVEEALKSPHYGEHLAKYWLDLVRFADTNGIPHHHYRA